MMSNMNTEIQKLATTFTESLIATVRASLHGAMADAMAAQLGEEPKVVRRRGIGQVGRMLRKAAKRVKAKAKAKTTERLARRSPEDLAKLEDRIAKFVAKHPEGSRAEDIRDSLGLVTKEMPLPLANLLDAGRLRKKGEKRATTYFATKKR